LLNFSYIAAILKGFGGWLKIGSALTLLGQMSGYTTFLSNLGGLECPWPHPTVRPCPPSLCSSRGDVEGAQRDGLQQQERPTAYYIIKGEANLTRETFESYFARRVIRDGVFYFILDFIMS
jgi:hypothetical protein